MADTIEQRVAEIERDLAEIPNLVNMPFELLRAEMRAANRQVELKFRALEEVISRTITETVRESEARLLTAMREMLAERDQRG
jgi:hypothetical protein